MAGKVAGFPIPTEIPFVGAALDQVEKLNEFVGDFEQLLEDTGTLEAVNGAIEGVSDFLTEKKDESSLQDEVGGSQGLLQRAAARLVRGARRGH